MSNILTTEQQQQLHTEIQDLLAGYVDQQLDEHQRQLVDAHIIACDCCREDLLRQQSLRGRLQRLSSASISPSMAARLDAIVTETKTETSQPVSMNTPAASAGERAGRWSRRKGMLWPLSAGLGWGLAALLLVTLAPGLIPESDIPMIDEALSQYQQLGSFSVPVDAPASDDDAKLSPVSWPGSRLISSWPSRVGGKQAVAYLYRAHNHTVLVLRIDEGVFFRNPTVRNAVAERGGYRQAGDLSVLAMPSPTSGLLIVGPDTALPRQQDLHIL